MKWIRQGDVVLKMKCVPKKGLRKVKNPVLAEGEVTGHFHKLVGEALYAESGDSQLLVLEQPTKLVHPEHDTVLLPKGEYEVTMQREVDVVGEVRQVMD